RALKGEGRPVISENDRAALVASLAYVDHVLIFDDPTPNSLLEQIRPNILVKGGTTGEVIGHEIVEGYGGRAIRVSASPGVSTTGIIAELRPECPPPEIPPPHSD